MGGYVKSIDAYRLFGRFDLHLTFHPGVNVVYGDNGSGKTTLLHILANALNSDFDRFVFLDFEKIEIVLGNDREMCTIELRKYRETSELERPDIIVEVRLCNEEPAPKRFSVNEVEKSEPSLSSFEKFPTTISEGLDKAQPISRVAYFPAYRTVIDAWKSTYGLRNVAGNRRDINEDATEFIRHWLMPFAPGVNYPSLAEIENRLSHEVDVSRNVAQFIDAVNGYLIGKSLIAGHVDSLGHDRSVELLFDDGYRLTGSRGMKALSSGEQQIVTLLYASTQLGQQDIVLVDEPELSLHVDWQRMLLMDIADQLENTQIIACTHSPVIGADLDRNQRSNLSMKPSSVATITGGEIPF